MLNSNTIEKKTMTTLVTEQLRKDILQRKFSAGQHVTVQDVADAYSTSAIPVREAFSVLHGEYLLEIVPYKGAIIRGVDKYTVGSIYDILRSMEVLIIESIIGNWTPELRTQISQVNEEIDKISSDEEIVSRFNQLNRDFHNPLEQFCTNERALKLRDQYHDYITIMTDSGRSHSLERVHDVYIEHKKIIQAIDTQDISQIREAYILHSINAEKELFRQLDVLFEK